MTTTGEGIEIACWEPCDWLVAFGVVEPEAFLAAARRQMLLPTDLDLDDEEVLVEFVYLRPDGETEEGDPLWSECAADAPGAVTATIWRG